MNPNLRLGAAPNPDPVTAGELIVREIFRHGPRTGPELIAALPLRPHEVVDGCTRLVTGGLVVIAKDRFALRRWSA